MPRVLVTGAAGFIGSHVAEHCLAMGYDVVAVDDMSGGTPANVPAGCDLRIGSVADPDFVAGLWAGGRFTYVYHLAAYAAEGLSHFIRRFNYDNNLMASINLINQSILHEAECFVFTSSIAVYGAGQTPMVETMAPEPEDPYGVSKYAVELDLRAANRMFGLPYVVFRPHNVYGERQNIADPYRNVIGIFMNQVMAGKPMTIFGDGSQTRAFSYIDDVAPIIARSTQVPAALNRTFNVGSDEPHSVLSLAQDVAAAFDIVDPKIDFLPARLEVLHAFSSHDAVREAFNPGPTTPLEEGLRRMSIWARSQGYQPPAEFQQEIEVWRNLPESWRLRNQKRS